jgi:PAS domain S-box-containing protein
MNWRVAAVLVTGFVLTVAFFLKARHTELGTFELRLEDDSTLRAEVLKYKLEQSLLTAEAVRHFFEGRDPEAVIAAGSASRLPFLDTDKGIWGIAWYPRPRPDATSRPGSEARKAFLPGLGYQPVAPEDDMLSSPGLRAGMSLAGDTGAATVCGRVGGTQGAPPVCAIACPVYDDASAATIETRRRALRGFILLMFRTDLLLQSALNHTEALGLGFDLLDLSADLPSRLLYRWTPRLKERESWKSRLYPAPPRILRRFPFAGREWAILFSPNRAYMGRDYPLLYWILLPGGMLLTSLLALYLQKIFSQRSELEHLVSERTAHLSESEARFRVLVEKAPDAILVYEADSKRFVDANSNAERMLGVGKRALLEADPAAFYPVDGTGSPATEPAMWKYVGLALDGQEPVFEQAVRTGTGSVSCETRMVRLPSADRRLVRISHIDITARKQAEAAMRQLSVAVRQSPVAIVITDLDGKIVFVNPKFSQVTGYAPEEAIGKNPRIMKSGNTRPEVYRALWDALKRGDAWEGEFHNRKKNGELFMERATIAPIRDESGVVTHYMAVKEDITEQRRVKDALRSTQERLRELVAHQRTVLEEDRTRIAREIHDELGQQLTVLGMGLYGMIEGKDPAVSPFAAQLRSMIDLVQETHAVIQRIIRELRPQVLDDLGFTAAIEWLAAQFEASSGIPIAVKISGSPVVSREIATAGFRIAQEALSNVMRHADARRAWVRLKEKRGILFLEVGDDGKGMDPGLVGRKGAHGLLGIQERALLAGGKMKVRRRRSGGTELVLLIPTRGAAAQEASE